MGLDMYLNRKLYVPHDNTTLKITGIKCNVSKVKYIEEEAMYWRKANAIHKWFVDNVQDGNDNCKQYYVDTSQLKELLDIVTKILDGCKLVPGKVVESYTWNPAGKKVNNYTDGKVMDNAELAHELLPTESGFFFGGIEYDEWYYKDLEYTKTELTKLLEDGEEYEYYYHASW